MKSFMRSASAVLAALLWLCQVAAFAQPVLSQQARAEAATAIYAASATQTAAARAVDQRMLAQRTLVESLRQRVTSERGRSETLIADLASAEERYSADLAAQDRSYAMEIAVFRGAVEQIASEPEGLEALARFNRGDELGALAVLDRLRDARQRARAVRDNLESGAEARRIAALALEAYRRNRLDLNAVILRYEEVTRLDPGLAWDWVELGRLYQPARRLEEAEQATVIVERLAVSPRTLFVALSDRADVRQAMDDRDGARELFERAFVLAERLAREEPHSLHAQVNLSVAYERLGARRTDTRMQGPAIEALNQGRAILQRLRAQHPDNYDLVQRETFMLDKLSAAHYLMGDIAGARAVQAEWLDLIERSRAILPEHLFDATMSELLSARAHLAYFTGDFAAAREAALASVAIRPEARTYRYLGDSERRLGNYAAAVTAFEAGLVEVRRSETPSLPDRRQMADILVRLGASYQGVRDMEAARRNMEEGIAIMDAVASEMPDHTDLGNSRAFAYERLGDLESTLENFDAALSAHRTSLEIRRRRVALGDSELHQLTDVAVSLDRISSILLRVQPPRVEEAIPLLQESVETRMRLAEMAPNNSRRWDELARPARALAPLLRERNDQPGALAALQVAARAHERALATGGPQHLLFDRWITLHLIATITGARADWSATLAAMRQARDAGQWFEGNDRTLAEVEAAATR